MKPIPLRYLLLLLLATSLSGCTWLNSPSKPLTPPGKAQVDVWKIDELEPDHLALARELVEKRLYDVALVQLGPAMEKKIPRAFDLAGVCARETGDYAGAKDLFSKALALDPNNASVHNNLGLLYAMDQHPQKARKSFEKAVALDPGHPAYLNNLGFLLLSQKSYSQAETWLEKSLSLNPADLTLVNNLALCLGCLGRHDHALDLLLAHHPEEDALFNMACIYSRCNEPQKAARLIKSLKDRSAFDIQTKNQGLQEGAGMPGDVANSIYEDKFRPAMKKD